MIDGFEVATYEKVVAPDLAIDGQGFASDPRSKVGAVSLLSDPEPVSGADTDLNSHISMVEWLAATDRRFDLLDPKHTGLPDTRRLGRPAAQGAQTMKLPVALVVLLALSACAPAGPKLPNAALDHAIGNSIGDPTTCVIVAERATGKTVYSYNAGFNCTRGLPACDRPGFLTAQQALAFAAAGRAASCNSNADASRTVGWAEGRVKSTKHDFIYSAVMEGQRALPGQEMSARLDDAFNNAGL